jgi:hypothetical protein
MHCRAFAWCHSYNSFGSSSYHRFKNLHNGQNQKYKHFFLFHFGNFLDAFRVWFRLVDPSTKMICFHH